MLVPTHAFHTLRSVPRTISKKLPKETSLHALLAAYLALHWDTEFATWNSVFPSLASFKSSVPLMWPPELQILLPQPAKNFLADQKMRFRQDWNTFTKIFSEISRDRYLHAWLLVNSRSFYYTAIGMERLSHNDRLALLPIADLFNHSDLGCRAEFSPQGYTFVSDRTYRAGEEVSACYGRHSNDFLLVEYGFVPTGNQWDIVCLDDAFIPRFSKEQKDALQERLFLGNYVLDQNMVVCFRTQVALRTICCTHEQWRQFVEVEVDEQAFQKEVDVLLMQFLKEFVAIACQTLEAIERVNVGSNSQIMLLVERWGQIKDLTMKTLGRFADH